MFVCLRCLFDRARELFVWQSQAGAGQKSAAFDAPIPLRKFYGDFLDL
jgi:hypothetical protein